MLVTPAAAAPAGGQAHWPRRGLARLALGPPGGEGGVAASAAVSCLRRSRAAPPSVHGRFPAVTPKPTLLPSVHPTWVHVVSAPAGQNSHQPNHVFTPECPKAAPFPLPARQGTHSPPLPHGTQVNANTANRGRPLALSPTLSLSPKHTLTCGNSVRRKRMRMTMSSRVVRSVFRFRFDTCSTHRDCSTRLYVAEFQIRILSFQLDPDPCISDPDYSFDTKLPFGSGFILIKWIRRRAISTRIRFLKNGLKLLNIAFPSNVD